MYLKNVVLKEKGNYHLLYFSGSFWYWLAFNYPNNLTINGNISLVHSIGLKGETI